MTEQILVVDDDEAVRETIGFVLTCQGYRCRLVGSGENALQLLDSGVECDLISSDVTNAPLSGIGFLQQVKKDFPEIPVVMVTGLGDASIRSICIQLGACDYLVKPFRREQLLSLVRRALDSGA